MARFLARSGAEGAAPLRLLSSPPSILSGIGDRDRVQARVDNHHLERPGAVHSLHAVELDVGSGRGA